MTVNKPWGSYTDYYRTDKVVFKLIHVNPKSQLSLQSHESRQEMWFVVEGECSCYLEEIHTSGQTGITSMSLKEGDYIFIPRDSKHRLSNRSEVICTVAEMQFGTCSEDDIVRYADKYGRRTVDCRDPRHDR
tara:strand:+ start:820 stop:1215 length:396 start_codon:yes stop_codon:yes gene_type:complete